MNTLFTKTVRWILAGVLATLLFLLLILLTIGSSVSLQVTQKNNLKDTINESGVYERVIPIGIDFIMNKIAETADQEEDISHDDVIGDFGTREDIENKLSNIFTPEWMREQTEGAIDGLYAFLEKESDEVIIEINFSEKEDEVRFVLVSFFKEHLNNLPYCERNTGDSIEDFNLFEAECLPLDADRGEISSLIDHEITNAAFLKDQSISLEHDKELTDPTRKVFFLARNLPILLWSVVLVFISLLFFLVPSEKYKLYAQSMLWGLSGASLAIIAVLAKLNFDNAFQQIKQRIDEDFVDSELLLLIKDMAFVVYNDITNRILLFAVVYILLAVFFLVLTKSHKYSIYFEYMKKIFIAIGIIGIIVVGFILFNAKDEGIFESTDVASHEEWLQVDRGVGFVYKNDFAEDLKIANEAGLVFFNAPYDGEIPEVIRAGFELGYVDFPVPNMAGDAQDIPGLTDAYLELVESYQPVFIGLGNEIELMSDRDEFVDAYNDMYLAIKEACHNCIVYPTFHYEQFNPDYVDRMELDLLVLTSYPFAHYQNIEDIPDDYYEAAFSKAEEKGVKVAFTEIGWTHLPAYTEGYDSTDDAQIDFYNRFRELIDNRPVQFVSWGLLYGVPELGEEWENMGLLYADGQKKNLFFEFTGKTKNR